MDTLNKTELVQLAQVLSESANRGMSREELIAIIEEEWDGPVQKHNINKSRHRLYEYIDANWKQLEALLSCPMRTRKPRSCFRCLDIQVAECIVTNPQIMKRDEDEQE